MNKIITIFTVFLVIVCPIFFSFSVSAQTVVHTDLPEPTESDIDKYFVIYNTDGSIGRIYAFHFARNENLLFVPTFSIDSSTDKWQYAVMCWNKSDMTTRASAYDISQYDLNTGRFLWHSHLETGTSVHQTTLTATNYCYYQTYGVSYSPFPNTTTPGSFPALGSIVWSSATEYTFQEEVLSRSLYLIAGELQQGNTNLSDLKDQLDDLNYLADMWFNNDYAFHNSVNSYLTQIQLLLEQIKILLGGNQEIPTFSDQSGLNNEVESYQQEEHSILDNYEEQMSNIDDAFNDVANDVNTYGNGFAFIKSIFEIFIVGNSLTYFVLFFALTFGLITLIIGRKT